MNYKLILIIFLPLLLIGCDQTFNIKNENLDLLRDDKYRNSGFALIYNDKLENIKKLLRQGKIDTIKYYRENPTSFAIVKGTDLIGDYIKDIETLLEN